MQKIRVHQLKSPWLILALLPFALLILFALAVFMLGSALFGTSRKRMTGRTSQPDHMPEVPRPARPAHDARHLKLDKSAAIDAEFRV